MTQGPPSTDSQRIERMPPQAVEVEQAVLGAMMIEQRAIGRAFEFLDESCFYHAPHAQIFNAILALYERGEGVDQLTLSEELKRRDQLDAVGGVVYLAKLATEVATAANIDYHAKIVLDKALSRKLIETASEVIEKAFEGNEEVKELIDRTEQRIFSLSENQISDGFEPLESVMGDALEQIESAHNRVSTVSGVDTGFTELNEQTSGFQKGDLIILAARPSVGKTALALTLTRNAAVETNTGVAVFSLEMSKMQLAQRLLSAETRVDLHKLRTGRLRDDDWMHLTRNVGRLAQAPIYIDDTPGITVLEARAKSRRLHREHGIGLIVVDYLQLMSSHVRVQSREQEISNISRGLKALAKELDVPVLALSQLSRAVESRTDRRPQLSDLRESGCLAGDTLIPRADTGERVPIRTLVGEAGVRVWALNPASKKLEKARVSNAFCTGTKQVYKLTTRLGRSIRATANHKFQAFEGWKRLDQLALKQHIALPRKLGSRDIIPRRAWPFLAKPAMSELGVSSRRMQAQLGNRYCGTTLYEPSLSSKRAVELARAGKSSALEGLAASDIYWDEIASIEADGVEEVFDLTVPGLHNFVADDIVVHNSIEQDADVVMFIYRPDIYGLKTADGASLEGVAEIIIGKQRNGPVGSVHMMWNAESATYEQAAPEWRLQPDEEF